MKKSFIIYFLLSIIIGLGISWIDSLPNWDDTGILVFIILLTAIVFGYLTFEKPWMIGLAISAWIPLRAILQTHNYGAFLALIPGFAGAYIGYFIKYQMTKK